MPSVTEDKDKAFDEHCWEREAVRDDTRAMIANDLVGEVGIRPMPGLCGVLAGVCGGKGVSLSMLTRDTRACL